MMTRRRLVLGALALTTAWPTLARAADPPKGPRPNPEDVWKDLIAGNKRFVSGKPHLHGLVQVRRELAKGQEPRASILGCSDSRVGPELVFDQTLGELFVVRTAGNVADPIALGSLEYGVEHLHTPLLIVLGHEKCGAVKAAAAVTAMPPPNLDAIVKRIKPAVDKVRGQAGGDQLVALGVEANVRQSAVDVLEASPTLRRAVDDGRLTVIRAIYRLTTGDVVRLS